MIIERHENCERCGLFAGCKSPFMRSQGSDEPLVLVVGEAPGEVEDEQDTPFVGKSGKLLRETLADAGLSEKDIRYTNVVRCRPPDNKISKRAINYCKHYALEEIEYYKPELVLLMGNSPLNAVLGEHGITAWNGVVADRDEAVYIPLYHPAYILRNPEAGGEWLDGIDKAVDVLVNGISKDEFNRYYPKTVREVEEMAAYLLKQDVIAYDTETGSLDPFHENNSIPCISFAAGNRTYGVALDHVGCVLSDFDYGNVVAIIERILTSPGVKIVGHNIKFDQLQTRHMLGIDFQAHGDTMLVSHMIDSRSGIHGLKRLAGVHLGMYDYDKALSDYIAEHPDCNPKLVGSYANIPLDVLLPYAALDTEATLKLWRLLFPQLSGKQQVFYNEVIIPASNALAHVEYNGNAIDSYIAERYVDVYEAVQQEILSRLLGHNKVRQTVYYFQREADNKILADICARYGEECTHQVGDNSITYTTPTGKKGQRKRNMIDFNPNSPHHIRYLYFDLCGVPVEEETESGLPSTKSDLMKQHAADFPIIRDVTYYKLLTKMLGTYIRPAATGQWMSGDGRVRSTYNLHGTRTGRLSSSNPNMQNIPTPEKEADENPQSLLVHLPIKNIFTHTFPGGVLMSVDYSGMELRVFASLADCQPMLEIHRMGGDFHSMVSIMAQTGRNVKDITKEESQAYKKQFPEVRYRYKWTNWTLLYGGDEYTLMNLYNMPEKEAKDTVKSYYDTFPEVLEFRQECIAFGEENGYIESPFGRRELLFYIGDDRDPGMRNKDRRAAVNMPVQSAASDILLCALIVIHDKLRQGKYKTMLVNTVHDSIVLDVHPDEIDAVAKLCVDVMENIVVYAKTYFPGVNFSWLKSPLKADVEVGTHYGTEISYKEWLEEQNDPQKM